jgi:hypothetical protein
MSCTINASTSAGLITSADTTGILQLQTNSGTTAVTIDTSQNVGIGTASPAYKLDVAGTNYVLRLASTSGTSRIAGFFSNTSGQMSWGLESSAGGSLFTGAGAYEGCIGTDVAKNFNIGTNGTIRATIDTSGNLGVGTTSPINNSGYGGLSLNGTSGALFSMLTNGTESSRIASIGDQTSLQSKATTGYITFVQGVSGGTERARITSAGNFCIGTTTALSAATGRTDLTVNGATTAVISIGIAGTRQGYIYAPTAGMNVVTETGDLNIQTTVANSVTFATNAVERARIDSSGNLLVGTTSNSAFTSRAYFLGSSTIGGIALSCPGSGAQYPASFNDSDATSTSQQMVHFTRAGTVVGYITTTNTTTSYSSASDYRLKNTISPMTGALAKVAQLKPVTYKWIADGSDAEGFIAHELAEVCPQAVHGTKDEVDADGKPVYQGIDTSFLVATLTAAIQELNTLITAQAAEITALKAKVGI